MKKIYLCRIACSLILTLLLTGFYSYAGNNKLYIATNKQSYASAETIQFQIFLLNTANANKTVYTELMDCKGNVLAKKMLPLTSGISWGSLELPGQTEAEFYILYSYVISKDTVEADCSKKIFIDGFNTPSQTGNKNLQLDFFTEGGTFISEMTNNLLITARDENSNPEVMSGKITDAKNNVFTSFVTDESGLAKISFNPEFKVQYFIVAENKQGLVIKKELPLASKYGVNLSVFEKKDSLTYTAFSYTADEKQLDYKLVIISAGNTVYKSDINFQVSLSFIQETLSLKDMPAGLLTFRITDINNKLYAQRIFYNTYENTNNTILKIVDTIGKKVAIVTIPGYATGLSYLNILDNDNADPINKNLPENSLKNFIKQPVIMNDPSNKITFNDFLISAEQTPFKVVEENTNSNPFLTLSGIVYNNENRPLKNKKINLIFLQKNSKKDYQVVTTDKNGSFEINSLIFYDTVSVYYQLAGNSEEKNNIRIDLKVTPVAYYTGNASRAVNFICADKGSQPGTPDVQVNNSMNLPDTVSKVGKTLTEVTVKGKKEKEKTNTDKFIEQNVSGQNNQSNFMRNEFDFIANPQVIDNTPIFEFLRGRISLSINISQRGDIKISTISGVGIGVYLDDMEITGDLEMASSLQVKDLALVRYYSMPLKPRLQTTKTKYSAFFGGGSNGGGGDLMIYTKKGFTPTEQAVKGLPKIKITGYDLQNPVISIPASQDSQQCLYWKPNWAPVKDETIYIGLPVNSPAKNIRLIIEGVNAAQTAWSFSENLVFN